MVVAKKIMAVLVVAAVGLVGFGMLPKPMADRLTKALVVIFLVGFAVRVGAYLLESGVF